MRKIFSAGRMLASAVAMALSSVAAAQESAYVGDDSQASQIEKPDGIEVGSFLVLPEFAVTQMYDSNIFATRDNEVDDTLTILYPSLSAESTWNRHELTLSAGGAFAQYYSNNDEDYDDYWADIDGRYDYSARTNLFGGAGLSSQHEDRSSPDASLAGKKPTTYDSIQAYGGISHQFDRATLRFGGTFERLDFENVTNLNNDDRDRDLLGAGARVTYRINKRYDLFLQGVWDKRDYDEQPDDNGFRRDSDGYRATAGVKLRFSNRLRGEAELGALRQDYDDSRFSTVNKPDFGGRLSWLASPRTRVAARLDRSLEESTLFGASSYLYTALSADLNHRLTSRLRLTATMTAGREDYQDLHREDDIYAGQVSLRYFLDPRLYLGAGYRVTSRDSNFTEEISNPASQQDPGDYGRNQVFITIGTLLYPVHQSAVVNGGDRLRLPRQAVIWPGLYAGGQLGYDASHIRTDGKASGAARRSELGDRGGEAGVFAGYGFDLGHWYLGAELEASHGWADIELSGYQPDDRSLAVERKDAYALTARLGYTVPVGVLLYARGGVVRSKFETQYGRNDLQGNAVDDSTRQTGVRYGVGADVPASARLFVRLDYSYTDFDSYTLALAGETERLRPAENLFRLGLGWRFGEGPKKKAVQAPIERRGFYTGVQIGHGSLNTELSGIQRSAGAATFDFEGDFGDQRGVTGSVFAGYGRTWKRWYAGLEAELGASTSKWKHREASAGREFSVEKKDSRGISLRGGYVLDNGALLYARAGGVKTRFSTEWEKGNDSSNDVNRDDTKFGTRVGLGAEIPLNRRGFVRLDYSYTDYESYDFVTSHTAADDVQFANDENLFNLALGAHF